MAEGTISYDTSIMRYNAGQLSNANDATKSGIYSTASTTSNVPASGVGLILVVGTGGWLFQLYSPTYYQDLYFRTRDNNTWKPWKKVTMTIV